VDLYPRGKPRASVFLQPLGCLGNRLLKTGSHERVVCCAPNFFVQHRCGELRRLPPPLKSLTQLNGFSPSSREPPVITLIVSGAMKPSVSSSD
jgi:hypothetical protein